MTADGYNYLPLSHNERGSNSTRWRSKDFWQRVAIAALVVSNAALIYFQYIASRRTHLTPLDDYQILKDHLSLAKPSDFPTNVSTRAVVSTLYNDLYTTPVATLGYSLAATGVSARRILMYIPGRLSTRSLCIVEAAGWELHPVSLIPPPHDGHDIVPRFSDQYTKLNLWKLDSIGVERVVYLDGDTLVRGTFDELFEMPWAFGAVPDVYDNSGFKLAFNAGVLTLRTSTPEFERMTARLDEARYAPQQAEQAFLNVYYAADAVRLPHVYNGNLVIKERSPELWRALKRDMKIVHYTSPTPFLKVGTTLLEGKRLQRMVAKAKSVDGGLYEEEIGWWEDAYEGMRTDNEQALEKCDGIQGIRRH
ncbi:glycosyltransferase family 8 protein [Auriscalpium vulgare]|uniref:Glycosyltransferase family 8 protein n=1 Tax=Auriscalpium vulgare TaxID=40419 RepID=A0ACB8RP12_9AGAM|nr:glycosyltransferase family 8 protein [Auriscalpium vulgare]